MIPTKTTTTKYHHLKVILCAVLNFYIYFYNFGCLQLHQWYHSLLETKDASGARGHPQWMESWGCQPPASSRDVCIPELWQSRALRLWKVDETTEWNPHEPFQSTMYYVTVYNSAPVRLPSWRPWLWRLKNAKVSRSGSRPNGLQRTRWEIPWSWVRFLTHFLCMYHIPNYLFVSGMEFGVEPSSCQRCQFIHGNPENIYIIPCCLWGYDLLKWWPSSPWWFWYFHVLAKGSNQSYPGVLWEAWRSHKVPGHHCVLLYICEKMLWYAVSIQPPQSILYFPSINIYIYILIST